MRKQDIKPGVVYAYQRSESYSPVPVVFLSTDLYTERGRFSEGAAALTRAQSYDKPGKDYLGRHTGYPVVFRSGLAEGTYDEVIPAMLSATIEGAVADRLPDGVKSDVLTVLGRVKGPYDEVMAEHQRQQNAESERRQAAEDYARDRRERGQQVIAALKARGVFASYRGHIELTVENAEGLIALLAKPEGN